MEITILPRVMRNRIWLLASILLLAFYLLYENLGHGEDWYKFFRPAALALVYGRSPYDIDGFYNAPWSLLPFVPLAWLPAQLGRVCVFVLSLVGFACIPYKLEAHPFSAILFLTSYPVVVSLKGGGLDWLPMLSFILPAPISLIFAAMKPQIGIGIALYWLWESWRVDKMRGVVRTFTPVIMLLGTSFLLYGFWFMRFQERLHIYINVSLFPYLVPLGIYFLYTRQKRAAMVSCICLSPYYSMFGLSPALVAFFDHPRLMLLAWLFLWGYPFSKFFI